MSDYDIHSCGYYCDRHACIVAQRNELRDKLFEGQAVKTYSGGKPNYTELPQPEPTIDGWPLYSGLPPVKVQDERETQYKSWAQSAQVIGGQYDPRRKWVGLTNDEIDDIWAKFNDGYGLIEETLWGYERAIEAKLKEKNG